MRTAPFCIILSLTLTGACQQAVLGEAEIKKIERFLLADGIEQAKIHVHRGTRQLGILHAIYAQPNKVKLELHLNPDRRSIREHSPTALLVTNAGFFTDAWKPTGFLKSSNKKLAPFISSGGAAGSGLVLLSNKSVDLLERSKTEEATLAAASFGIQAGPRIIEKEGKAGIRSDDRKHRNRTLIGADKRGRLVIASFISHSDWSDGLSLFEVQNLFMESNMAEAGHKDLSLEFALNLDGGPSTGFHLRHKRSPVNAAESKPVHSVLSLEIQP